MLKRTIAALVVAAALRTAALAQVPPYAYPRALTTSPTQVLADNPARKRLIFFNPNATVTVAVCPVLSRVNSAAITCAVNGAGSITLLPYGSFVVEGGSAGGGPLQMRTAWNGVASGSGNLTILEFE